MIDLIEGAFFVLILLLCCLTLVGLVAGLLSLARIMRKPRPTAPYVRPRYKAAVKAWHEEETRAVPKVPHG